MDNSFPPVSYYHCKNSIKPLETLLLTCSGAFDETKKLSSVFAFALQSVRACGAVALSAASTSTGTPHTGPLKDSSTRRHAQWKTLPLLTYLHRRILEHTHSQQRKTPHSQYKSWQFGNWAFGLTELWRQPPEPDDRKRDLNKRIEYWSEQQRRGNVTVKM